MIQIIAFSFNRAMQLDTLLSSFISHWKQPDYWIDIIYNYSSDFFGRGYEKLADDYKDKPITLHREKIKCPDKYLLKEILCPDNAIRLWRNPKLRHPKSDFRSILVGIMEKSEADNVMFLTDDSMFIRDIAIPIKDLTWINEKPSMRQFSLRLGKGVSSLPDSVTFDDDYCTWNMYDNQGNWGYPFSVDAHIYNKKYVLELYKKYVFTNPNTLEANVCSTVRRKKMLGEARCFTDIKMLTFPINIVQNVIDNHSQNVSVEMLNERYLKGEHLKYVVEKDYNPAKQYVGQIEFTDAESCTSVLSISDSQTGQFEDLHTHEGRANEISIIVAGDFSPKERLQRAIDCNEWQGLFPGVRELLNKADYSIVNFESTIANNSDKPIKKIGSHLETTYPSMFVLKSLGFDMITLANNHSLDYGADALRRTIKEAGLNGIANVGAGKNLDESRKPKMITLKGATIAIINCCENEFSIATETDAGANPLDFVDISRQIKECKGSADYVLLIIHGGVEHFPYPSPRMKKLYRFFIDQGADAIVNHHQHCFCGYEVYQGKPIFYGVGNFCFDSSADRRVREQSFCSGCFVELLFSDSIGFNIYPYVQCGKIPGLYLLEGDDLRAFEDRMNELNSALEDDHKLSLLFHQMSVSKQGFIYRGFRPYNTRFMKGLYSHRVLPSFLSRGRLKEIQSIVRCESHRDILLENLDNDNRE